MTQHVAVENLNTSVSPVLSRRQVMIGAAGLTFAAALAPLDDALAAAPAAEMAGRPLSPWVSIAPLG